MNQPCGLISVLLDSNADEASRDDAAIDLGTFDDKQAEFALASAASTESTPEIICASCGESLAEIWNRNGKVNTALFQSLTPIVKNEAMAYLEKKISPTKTG